MMDRSGTSMNGSSMSDPNMSFFEKHISNIRQKAFENFILFADTENTYKKALLAHENYLNAWKNPLPTPAQPCPLVTVTTSLGNDGSFWCQIHTAFFEDDNTLHHINDTLKSSEKMIYILTDTANTSLQTPLYFHSKSKDLFLRCLIEKHSSNKILVRYLDLGITGEVESSTQFYYLPQENVHKHPFKSVYCTLPVNADIVVPYEAKWKFRDLTAKQTMKIQIVGERMQNGQKAHIVLLKSVHGLLVNDQIINTIKEHDAEILERKKMNVHSLESSPEFKKPHPLKSDTISQAAANLSTGSKDIFDNTHVSKTKSDRDEGERKSRSRTTSENNTHSGTERSRNSSFSIEAELKVVKKTTERKVKDVKKIVEHSSIKSSGSTLTKAFLSKSHDNLSLKQPNNYLTHCRSSSLAHVNSDDTKENDTLKYFSHQVACTTSKEEEKKPNKNKLEEVDKENCQNEERLKSKKANKKEKDNKKKDKPNRSLEKNRNDSQEIYQSRGSQEKEEYWVDKIPLSQRKEVEAVIPPFFSLEYTKGIFNRDPWQKLELYNINKLLGSQAKVIIYLYDLKKQCISDSLKTGLLAISKSFAEKNLFSNFRNSHYIIMREYAAKCSNKYRSLLGICKYDKDKQSYRPYKANQLVKVPVTYLSLSKPSDSRKWEALEHSYGMSRLNDTTAKSIVLVFQKSLMNNTSQPIFSKIFPWCGVPPIMEDVIRNKAEQKRRVQDYPIEMQQPENVINFDDVPFDDSASFNMEPGEVWEFDESEKENSPNRRENTPNKRENISIKSPAKLSLQNNSPLKVNSILENTKHQPNNVEETSLHQQIQQITTLQTNMVNPNIPLVAPSTLLHSTFSNIQQFMPTKILQRNPNGADGYINGVWYPDLAKAEISHYFPTYSLPGGINTNPMRTFPNSVSPPSVVRQSSDTSMLSTQLPLMQTRRLSDPEIKSSTGNHNKELPSSFIPPTTSASADSIISESAERINIEENIQRILTSPVGDYFHDVEEEIPSNLNEENHEGNLQRRCSTFNLSREDLE